MIYKIEIEDESYIEVFTYRSSKDVCLHVAELERTKENVLVENYINFEIGEEQAKSLIKAIKYALDDIDQQL